MKACASTVRPASIVPSGLRSRLLIAFAGPSAIHHFSLFTSSKHGRGSFTERTAAFRRASNAAERRQLAERRRLCPRSECPSTQASLGGDVPSPPNPPSSFPAKPKCLSQNLSWRVIYGAFASTGAERPPMAVSTGAHRTRRRWPPGKVLG